MRQLLTFFMLISWKKFNFFVDYHIVAFYKCSVV